VNIRRVGIVFAGGPAPAANAVIAAAGVSLLDAGLEVVGFYHGYSNLALFDPVQAPLLPDQHFRLFADDDLRGIRSSRGVVIGTSRVGPGREIRTAADLDDASRLGPLRAVRAGLLAAGVQALISIGGDGTLRTANLLVEMQRRLPPDEPRVAVVHVPKTIDNDYPGIDFTFGFFTAVDVLARELHNLRADAQATSGWFLVETRGRRAGWLAYGVGIAGEADLTIGVEDVPAAWRTAEGYLDPLRLVDQIVDTIVGREARGKHYGVVVLAEGLAEMLAPGTTTRRDDQGRVVLAAVDLGRTFAGLVADRYAARTGRKKKVTGLQLGYESRAAPPHAFDVMLASQLGVGAYRALIERGLDGVMISIAGQFELRYVPFSDLVDPVTLRTRVRLVEPGSDFHQLARFLESRTARPRAWGPGLRREE
jgi:6-phosphofructokinase 1